MEDNKTSPQPQQTGNNQPAPQQKDSSLSEEQLENITGGTAVPVRKLEDVENTTVDRPIDVVQT